LGPRRVLLVAAGAVVVAAAVLAVVLSSGDSQPSRARYGGLPAWLPKPPKAGSTPLPRATLAHPWLSAVEGETVSVDLPAGRVLATVVGPSIPEGTAEKVEKDDDSGSDQVPVSFSATFSSASGVVPLRPNAFTILGERGETYRLRVTNAAGGPLPTRVSPGHSVTLAMKASLPEGEAALRWAPDGRNVIAGWVFGLELD
jgi:hypothetical protein